MRPWTLLSAPGRRAAQYRLSERFIDRAAGVQSPTIHAQACIHWLLNARQVTADGGVAQSYNVLSQRWGPSYPETTGYIICSLLRAARAGLHDPAVLRDTARDMGRWLLTTQLTNGAFPGGAVGTPNPQPAVFNTGQILKGFTDLIQAGLADGDIRRAAERTARWLVALQDADGCWHNGRSTLCSEPDPAYHIRTAWALARYGTVVNDAAAVRAGVNNGNWLMATRQTNGWFPHMNFSKGEEPLLHSVAYTINGLYELGVLTGNDDFATAAEYSAARIRDLQDPENGSLPGRIEHPYRAGAPWTSPTANAQMAIVWFRLAEVTGDVTWRIAAERATTFNCALQELDHSDPGRRGAVRGSFPAHIGDEGRFSYLNWTQKFHLDALLAQMGARVC